MNYKTSGVCSTNIEIELDGSKIKTVEFTGGCNGNLKGISTLVVGMEVKDAISKLKGITCGGKNTSCPDQLALALSQIKK